MPPPFKNFLLIQKIRLFRALKPLKQWECLTIPSPFYVPTYNCYFEATVRNTPFFSMALPYKCHH